MANTTMQPIDCVISTPYGWDKILDSNDGAMFQRGALRVIISAHMQDGVEWLHVSASRPNRIPDHADMATVKRTFMGDRYAYAVWPPQEFYVNINPRVLHLWARLDGAPVLPEFSAELPGVGRSI